MSHLFLLKLPLLLRLDLNLAQNSLLGDCCMMDSPIVDLTARVCILSTCFFIVTRLVRS